MFRPPGDCPACGDYVRPKSRACPHCGADERSGWQEDNTGNGLDLPDEEFNYEAFLENEFGQTSKRRHLHPVWWITGIILLGLTLISLFQTGLF